MSLLVLVFLVAGSACSRQPHHPTNISTEGLPAKVSQPVEFVLASTVGQSGTLLDVRVVDPSPGLRVVDAGLVQAGDVANGEPYPPRNPVTPLPAPYHGSTLVAIAVRADQPGNYDGLGVLLTWSVGDKTNRVYLPLGFRLCVGASTCDPTQVTEKIAALDTDEVLSA
jgi:hypothetical protein